MTAQTSAVAVTAAAPATAETISSLPRVIGIDPSLSGTGVAGATWTETIAGGTLSRIATRQQQWERLRRIKGRLAGFIDTADLVVVEALPPSNYPGVHERAYLLWWILGRCISRDIDVAEIQPSTLKVYATGNGRAAKVDMVQQLQRRRPDVEFRGDNEADSAWLAMMGLDHLGHPVITLPQTHRRALDSITWPAP